MNRNELLSTVQHELAKTIEPMVTEYIHNHPEYFQKCTLSDGLIADVDITLSYQPENLSEAVIVRPCVFIRLADSKYGSECNRFSHRPEQLCYITRVDNKRVSEYEEDF